MNQKNEKNKLGVFCNKCGSVPKFIKKGDKYIRTYEYPRKPPYPLIEKEEINK